MTTLTATDARREFFDIISGAAKSHKIYRISHRKGATVLMSEEDYESLIESLELLSIPGFRASMKKSVRQMKKGETFSFEEVLYATH
ncbi:MAG: prevent-host-death protein [Elusimicrobia bacterium HGW-Elusimicrobia-2]|nr:MAG: prevent-host-death protein [Elusimicrobia bacterium HGW-Elusimicrobia-2]